MGGLELARCFAELRRFCCWKRGYTGACPSIVGASVCGFWRPSGWKRSRRLRFSNLCIWNGPTFYAVKHLHCGRI